MPGESLNAETKVTEFVPTVNDLSTEGNQITVSGVINDVDQFEYDHFELMLKKRRTTLTYTFPLTWTNENWTGTLNVKDFELGRGVWDFYLYNIETKSTLRVKTPLEKEYNVTGEGLYKVSDQSLHFNLYRTIKNSLSLNIKTARISLNRLQALHEDENSWEVKISGQIDDSFFQHQLKDVSIRALFIRRHTLERTEYPVKVTANGGQHKLEIDVDYRQMIDFDNVAKGEWDCYLIALLAGDDFVMRIHVPSGVDTLSLEKNSLTQFNDGHLYQMYFYETVKHHLSIKLHRASIKRDIEQFTIELDSLRLKGFAYLDVDDPKLDETMERFITIRKRESKDEFQIKLANGGASESNEPHSFDVKLPWKRILELEKVEKEIFDLSLQIHYQDAVYERKLGFEEFNYIKDAVLSKVFIKNIDHYTRIYLTLTPWGNLKIETFYLTTAAYFYLKFGQKIDVKLNGKKDIWLIGERANTAQDTGYQFFKYCREHYPDREIYYVINSGSKDVKHIEALGNVLYTGTLKHVRKASVASAFIGSHDLDNILPLKGLELESYVDGKRVFLQHGVLGRKNVEYHTKYYAHPFHLFCVSSLPEKNMVEKKMDYKPSEVKITGLSRFDELLEPRQERQSILLMPTWREWLGNDERFKNSIYYQRYKSLLTNKRLLSLLEEYDLTLDFYPHYRMQSFIDEFKDLKSERINIIQLGEKTVQQLLKENKLLITDYSSVSFDFNYMSKPIIFYHFDSRAFFKNGILRPVAETFLGDICHEEKEVVEAMTYYLQHDCQEREEIRDKKESIFSYMDTNNNKRIFEEITKLVENE